MANVLSNEELKYRNEKILKSIEQRLAADDEKTFIEAADKITKFIGRKEAYYAEARPLIGEIFKTARATLTRLSNSPVPFQCSTPFSATLESRVKAYRRLLATGFKHAGAFAGDYPLREELKGLFASAQTTSPVPAERRNPTAEQQQPILQSNGQTSARQRNIIKKAPQMPSSMLPATKPVHGRPALPPLSTAPPLDANRREFRQSTGAPPSPAFSTDSPSNRQSAPLPGDPIIQSDSSLTALRQIAPKPTSPALPSPLSMIQPNSGRISATMSASPSASPVLPSPSLVKQPNSARISVVTAASPTASSMSSRPTTPTTPSTPSLRIPEASSSTTPSSAKVSSAKSTARPKKKPKLGKSSLVNSTLVQEDVNWYSSKQRNDSVPVAPPAQTATVKEEHISSSQNAGPLPDVPRTSANSSLAPLRVDVRKSPPVPKPAAPTRERKDITFIDLTTDDDVDMVLAPVPAPASLSLVQEKKAETKDSFPSTPPAELLCQPSKVAYNSKADVTEIFTSVPTTRSPAPLLPECTPRPPIQIGPTSSDMDTLSNSEEAIWQSPGETMLPPCEASSVEQKSPRPSAVDISIPDKVSKDRGSSQPAPGDHGTAEGQEYDGDIARREPVQPVPSETKQPDKSSGDTMDVDGSEAMTDAMNGRGPSSSAASPREESKKEKTPAPRDTSQHVSMLSAQSSSATSPLKLNSWHDTDTTVPSSPMKSIFGPSTAVYVSVELGQTTGSVIVMDFELSPGQESLLSLWKTREQHEQDTSNSICLSLACYKQDDAVEAALKLNDEDSTIDTSALAVLTALWPTNSRLSADIGSFRLFLAPPIQMTAEKLVDVTDFVEGRHIEVRLDHAGDMTSYVFALIAHPPTASQLQNLEEKRAKNRKWRAFLDDLSRPFTLAEVFG